MKCVASRACLLHVPFKANVSCLPSSRRASFLLGKTWKRVLHIGTGVSSCCAVFGCLGPPKLALSFSTIPFSPASVTLQKNLRHCT